MNRIFVLFFCINIYLLINLISFKLGEKIKINNHYYILSFLFGTFSYLLIGFLFSNRTILFLGNILTLNSIFRISNSYEYEDYSKLACNTQYSEHLSYTTGDGKNINIILIFAESLSAIDSKKYGGFNNMPGFDKISDNGITYYNFISNGANSQSAHIATLLGVQPWTYNSYTGYNTIMDPIIKYMNKNNYNTIFISTVPLSFVKQRDFLNNIGFKKIIGEDAFNNKKHYVMNAAPDEDLYKKALNEIKKQDRKFFIGMQTISYHEPWNNPYGNDEITALKYSDEKLLEFFNNLKDTGFFKNGILIVVGDHRAKIPIKKREYEKIGKNWYTKTVATVIGTGIVMGGTCNEIIQHTDIYNSLKKLIGTGLVEIDSTFNDIFECTRNRNWSITLNPTALLGQKNFTLYVKDKTAEIKSFDSLSDLKSFNEDVFEYLCSYMKFEKGFENMSMKIRNFDDNY